MLGDLTFGETVVANAVGAFLVAVFAALVAVLLTHRWEVTRYESELRHEELMQKAEQEHQRYLREANEDQAVALPHVTSSTKAPLVREGYALLLTAQRGFRVSPRLRYHGMQGPRVLESRPPLHSRTSSTRTIG